MTKEEIYTAILIERERQDQYRSSSEAPVSSELVNTITKHANIIRDLILYEDESGSFIASPKEFEKGLIQIGAAVFAALESLDLE